MKEVRQALKSRQFVGTFLLLLLAAWAGSIFGVSYLGESIDYGSSAVMFYAGFLFALCVATLVIVPFSTFRSIVEERTETTLELLQITALSPLQIVRGKTLSAMVQVLVYYCAIAPFIAFTALLPGFDIVHVTFSLVMLFITALCFSLVALAIGAHARKTTSQSLSSLFVIAMAFGGMMAFFSFMTAAGKRIRFDEPDTWWALALIVFLGLSTGICLRAGGRRTAHVRFRQPQHGHPAGRGRTVASLLDRIADISDRAPAAADAFRRVDRHFDADRDVHHGCGAVVRRRARFSVAARQPRPAPLAGTEGALGPLSAGWGARPALCPRVAGACWAFFVTVLVPQLTPTSILNDRQATRYAIALAAYSLIYLGAGTLLARLLRRVMHEHPFVSGARDSGAGEPALDRCGSK